MTDTSYIKPNVKARLERLGEMSKIYYETRSLYKTRKQLSDETLEVKQKIYSKLVKEVKYLLKYMTAYRILREIGMEYENLIYPIRKKLLKENRIDKENIKQPEWKEE